LPLNEKQDSENYQKPMEYQTLFGEFEETQPLKKSSDSGKESF